MLTKKGIIFTLDAIFAIIAALTIISTSFLYMGQLSKIPYNKQALNKISQDSLTILEKDGTLKHTIEINSTASITLFLNSLPSQICANISLFNSSQNMINTISKSGCNSSEEIIVARRGFIANNFSIYYAKIESWFK